jgi:type I restriction enzyme S subunit
MKEVSEKKGFKKTKLGWIPKEWWAGKIQDLVDDEIIQKPMDGNHGEIHPVAKDFVKSGIPFIMANCIKDEQLKLGKCNFLRKEQADKLQKGFSIEGDILFTHKGTVGATAFVNNIDYPYIMLTPQVTYYRCLDDKKIDKRFLRLLFQNSNFQSVLEKLSGGGTRAYIGISAQRSLPVYLPPLPEQQKIAEILSTWDTAITNTQELITQLKSRKKGLMQQLLTGQKRLKGFSGEWKLLRGNEIFKNHTDKSHNGEFEVLSATQDKGVIPRSETGIDIKYDKSSLKNYKKIGVGDFIISLRSFQGGIEYSNYEGLVSPAYTVLRENLPISKLFYREYMKTENFIKRLNSIIYGIRDGKQISYKDFGTLKIFYPPIDEQNKIAEIIEESESEMELAKEKLIKLQNQKKGLMQQLLTGQKRVRCAQD